MALTQEQTQELKATVEQRRAALRDEVSRDLGKMLADLQVAYAGAASQPAVE